jgi:hypothetical protein
MAVFFLICLSFFLLFFLLGGAVFIVRARREKGLAAYLEEHGSTMQGQIISHRRRSTGRGGVVYYVMYQYECDGKLYSSEQMVTRDHFGALKDGEQVSVRSLPPVPTTAMLAGDNRDDARAKRQGITALFSMVVALILVISIVALWMALLGQH